ncbi:hypothetical protein [Streptomyces sp. NBC_00696]|uniref:hypothetical protein n=1 Tax=Streptomyces sp. NBC_00696 TaxID=2903672 RepID=UPI002E2EF03A|nr:hypothetical protein [Streptomyces sp. NBC_00696]
MTAKSEHEDEALRLFCSELTARGFQATITSHPDRDPHHPLSVDALISVDGDEWAVDHCLLSRAQNLPAAMKAAEAALQAKLDQIAVANGQMIVASYLPQTGTLGERWGEGYYERIIDLAKQAVTAGGLVAGDDGFATVQAIPSETPGAALTPFTDTTGNPLVSAQVTAGLREPLLKKLDGQLRKAQEAGYRTALLLDQVPRPGAQSHTVWMASPTVVAGVTASILQEHREKNGHVLDQVWLRPGLLASPLVAPAVHLLIA